MLSSGERAGDRRGGCLVGMVRKCVTSMERFYAGVVGHTTGK
jgi:hypothetical protein